MRLRDFQPDIKKIANFANQIAEEVVSSVDQVKIQNTLSRALDWFRPFSRAIGLRLQVVSQDRIQAILPAKSYNLRSNQEFFESTTVHAAIEMARLLLQRWEYPIEFNLEQIQWQGFQKESVEKKTEDLILRLEWDDLVRESLRAELLQSKNADQSFYIYVSDSDEKRVADIQLKFKIKYIQGIGREQKGKHADPRK